MTADRALAFALVAWSLAREFAPASHPGWDATTSGLLGVGAALALLASVLIHELSHAFVALARGLRVRDITLFIFGGVATIKGEAERPRDELLISVVGPLASFALAALFWALAQVPALGDSPVGATLGYLALCNALLGALHLLPGYPLDGGRVLRSAIWGAGGKLRRATRVTTYVCQGFGLAFVVVGVSQLLGGNVLVGCGSSWSAGA